MFGDLVVVFLVRNGAIEIDDLLARLALVASQQRAHHVEIQRILDLLVGQVVRPGLGLRDPLVGDRVIAQIERRVAFGEAAGALQTVEECAHGVGIEARGDETREADAVGFVFVLAREIDLLLRRQGLRAGNRRLRGLAAVRATHL